MAQRHCLLALVGVYELAAREEIEHRLVEALDEAVLQRDADQTADHRLGRRVDAVAEPWRERREVGFDDDLAVAHDQEAVHAVADAEGHEIGQLLRAHALGFRRGGRPLVGARHQRRKQEGEKGSEEFHATSTFFLLSPGRGRGI